MDDLKPCPFCGGKCCVQDNVPDNEYAEYTWYCAHCQDCGCNLDSNEKAESFETRQEAVNAWNTRI